MTSAQHRTYSLIARNLCPPLEAGCVEALRQAIKAKHVVIRNGEFTLTDAGKAEFEFAEVSQ